MLEKAARTIKFQPGLKKSTHLDHQRTCHSWISLMPCQKADFLCFFFLILFFLNNLCGKNQMLLVTALALKSLSVF